MECVVAPPKDGIEPPTSAERVVAAHPAPPCVPAPAQPDPAQLADADAMPPGVPIAPEGQPDAALPAHALYRLATARLAERDLAGALQACQLAREIDPTQADYAALAVWIHSLLGGADLAARVGEFDALLEACGDHVQALFYRGFLRRRIGNEAGAERDLRRALELDPKHRDAARELRRLELGQPATRPSGLYKRS
jgi:tetratricopeptide (TPR) repeat protein